MTYSTDDLTPLFGSGPATGAAYRQGVVKAWNPATAENTLDVGGALVENLPILNTSEALLISPGDVVGILTTGGAASSWMILGRVTVPGTPGTASALAAIGTTTAEAPDQESTTSTSWTDLASGPSVTVKVRPSGRVLVFYAAQIGWFIEAPGAAGGQAGIDVSGANTMSLTGATNSNRQIRAYKEAGGANTNVGIFGVGSHTMFTGLNPGETTFKLRYRSLFGQQIDFDNRAITALVL